MGAKMNTFLSYVVAVVKDPYLFEFNPKISDFQKEADKQHKRQHKSPAFFNAVPHDARGHNTCYEALYVLLNYLHHITNFFMFIVLVQHLGIQMVNVFAILYCFQEIVILAPVYAISRVAHVSLTRLIQGGRPLSFVAYAWTYILLSLIVTTVVAALCTLLRDTLLSYLLGDLAPWCLKVYMTSVWIDATVVTVSICMQHILMAEERSVLLLGALAAKEFAKIFVFIVYIFYLSMPMARNASYWTGEFNESIKLPTSEFFHDAILYSTKPGDVSSATTMQELMLLLNPHYIQQENSEASQLIMKVHLYSYHISILFSSCTFILVSACLLAYRTREMGWAHYKKDPIVVSCTPFMYGLLVLFSDGKGLAATIKHLVISWIPVYLDRISILVPLLTMCITSRQQIMAAERSTLKMMQLTLFRLLYDTYNSLSLSIVELFTAAIVRAHTEHAYKIEVRIKRCVMILCIVLSVGCYPVMIRLNKVVTIFKQFNYNWLTPVEKLWIDEIYNDSGTLVMQDVNNVLIGAHTLLVMHLLMDQKIITIYLLSLARFFFCFILMFSSIRSPTSRFTSIQELAICNIIVSIISVLGLILSSSKYNIS